MKLLAVWVVLLCASPAIAQVIYQNSASKWTYLGSDAAYWTTASNVILRVKSEMLQERILNSTTA